MSTEQLRFLVQRHEAGGALVPADGITAGRLRERGYTTGSVVMAQIKKPRNPGFHRLSHSLGKMVAENIDAFHGLDPHTTLKRLQLESGIACDEVRVQSASLWDEVIGVVGESLGEPFARVLRDSLPEHTEIPVRVPQSLSFASMDEGQFREFVMGISAHVAATYWPEMGADEVAAMAEAMPEEAA